MGAEHADMSGGLFRNKRRTNAEFSMLSSRCSNRSIAIRIGPPSRAFTRTNAIFAYGYVWARTLWGLSA